MGKFILYGNGCDPCDGDSTFAPPYYVVEAAQGTKLIPKVQKCA